MTIQHRQPNQTIKKELQKRGITQTQAAFDLGINRVKFNTFSNGWDLPNPETRRRIAEYLNMPEQELFG